MLILKRKNGAVETFDIPDSVLVELQRLCDPAKEKKEVDALTAAAIDLYKLEYERALERYNNLYNSAWTNFSYMVLVAGGIVTFGGQRFIGSLTIFLACVPLLFWFIATFVPLDRYGRQVEERIVEIEDSLLTIGVFEHLKCPANQGLQHFKKFSKRRKKRKEIQPSEAGYSAKEDEERKTYWRVRNVVWIAAGVLIITMGTCVWYMVPQVKKGGLEALSVPEKPTVTLNVIPAPTPSPATK
jgi:hypothetical protein